MSFWTPSQNDVACVAVFAAESSRNVGEETLRPALELLARAQMPIQKIEMARAGGKYGTLPASSTGEAIQMLAATTDLKSFQVFCNPGPTPQYRWEATLELSVRRGIFFVGLPARTVALHDLVLDFSRLLWRDYGCKYGFGFYITLDRGGDFFAEGTHYHADPRNAFKTSLQERKRIGAWGNELAGRQRHLEGYFREVYPANLLSIQHITNLATAKLHGSVGNLSEIGHDCWLWEVPEAGAEMAQQRLTELGVIISQKPA